ncbi:MAG: 16S rRNA (guanine(966)-N(2))-methyltransferase RsmD [Sphingobacteriales bacterium]|nr:MAG: 16S rRNA (guanine(966)-N(2))-methyltransferase RsmD [Sphingobacteriales bacterium]
MRIVGGEFSGRRFNPPASTPARPTTDVAKESLFNILENMMDIEGIKTCDIFSGTGSISYELASRGAEELVLVERDTENINFIKKTAAVLGISSKLQIVRGDAFKFMKQNTEQYDLIFADPPYALPNIDDIPMLVFDKHMLAPNGIFVMEHSNRNNYQQHPNFTRMKNYGTTIFSFFTQPA